MGLATACWCSHRVGLHLVHPPFTEQEPHHCFRQHAVALFDSNSTASTCCNPSGRIAVCPQFPCWPAVIAAPSLSAKKSTCDPRRRLPACLRPPRRPPTTARRRLAARGRPHSCRRAAPAAPLRRPATPRCRSRCRHPPRRTWPRCASNAAAHAGLGPRVQGSGARCRSHCQLSAPQDLAKVRCWACMGV